MSLSGSFAIATAVVLLVGLGMIWHRSRRRLEAKAEPEPAAAAESEQAAEPTGPMDTDAAAAAAAAEAAATQALSVRAETLRATQELAFGTSLPQAAIQIPPNCELCVQVGTTLSNIVEKPSYAPRRPMQLPRLLQAMNDETASRGVLSQIIAGDPALAGHLLRLANSPFYRHSPEPIESLDRAVAMLGIEGLRSMIAAALLQPVFRISGGGFAKFGEVTWEHSLYAAGASEAHATLVGNADPFAAQLLALILGLANIVVFSVSQDAFLARQRKPEAGTIAALIGLHAIAVARQIAKSWELSERIDTALADQLASGTQATGSSPLGRALQFGVFIGALAVLRSRAVIDDQTASAVLQSVQAPAGVAERIWGRMGFTAF
jgi:HD-like signal output (HDOD) protein